MPESWMPNCSNLKHEASEQCSNVQQFAARSLSDEAHNEACSHGRPCSPAPCAGIVEASEPVDRCLCRPRRRLQRVVDFEARMACRKPALVSAGIALVGAGIALETLRFEASDEAQLVEDGHGSEGFEGPAVREGPVQGAADGSASSRARSTMKHAPLQHVQAESVAAVALLAAESAFEGRILESCADSMCSSAVAPAAHAARGSIA